MALKEKLIKPPAIIQRLNLLGVAARDCRHHIGIHDARFHPVDITPELQAAQGKDARAVQPRLIQNGGIPAPLVLQVMDRIDNARCPLAQQMEMRGAQVGGAGGRLPIMQVDDVGGKAEQWQRLQQALAKEQETSLLIALVQTEVEPLMSSKESFVVKQIDDD